MHLNICFDVSDVVFNIDEMTSFKEDIMRWGTDTLRSNHINKSTSGRCLLTLEARFSGAARIGSDETRDEKSEKFGFSCPDD